MAKDFDTVMKTGRFSGVSLAAKILLMLLPVLWGLFIVWKFGVNVAWADEMRFFQNKQHFLSFEYLWAQHNEHRMLFPKLVAYLVGTLFSWNSKALMYSSQFMLFAVYYISIRMLLGEKKWIRITWLEAMAATGIGFCIYNTSQYENLLWGFQIAWFMIVLFGVLSYEMFHKYLQSNRTIWFVLAMAFAVIASFSSMHGMTVWGGYLAIILVRVIRKEKISSRTCIEIGLTCALTLFLYFYRWEPVAQNESLFGSDLKQASLYFFALIGENFISSQHALCYIAGAVLALYGVCWMVQCIVKKTFVDQIRLCGPMILGLGSLAVIALGRSNVNQVQPRYLTASMVFLAFLLLVCVLQARNEYKNGLFKKDDQSKLKSKGGTRPVGGMFRKVFVCTGVLILISVVSMVIFHNTRMKENLDKCYTARVEVRNILKNYQAYGMKDYQKIHPMTEDELDEWISVFDMMKEEKLNVFAD